MNKPHLDLTRRQFIGLSAGTLGAVILAAWQLKIFGQGVPPGPGPFLRVELEDAYITYDEIDRMWSFGNVSFEERIRFTPEGGLREVSLVDKSNDRHWRLHGSVVGLDMVDDSDPEGVTVDAITGWTLADTAAKALADGSLEAYIQMDHETSGQTITVQIRVRPVHPVIERRALIANNSARPMRAVRLDSVSLGM
ncbi:MAG: hypothetical protein Q7O66_06270, partial [Dehalococcoidia bacterium]|nr:hypothetical protein [Dehalococcoidia bacterium]